MIKALRRTLPLLAAIVAVSALASAGTPAQAAKADRCTAAWDCHGPLPQICLKCSDGHFECAHWACVHHRCVMQTCPKKK
jgi:hypothetical protein